MEKKNQTKKPNTLVQTPDVHSFPLWPLVCKGTNGTRSY